MQITRRKPLTANIAMFSVGLKTYWQQFPGLLEEMQKKSSIFAGKVKTHSVNLFDFGMVDDTASACRTAPAIAAVDPDILFVEMTTYAPSCVFAPVIRQVKCPVILVALQPLPAMDYARGTTFMQLCNDDICSVPEFTGVAERMGKSVNDIIIGKLHDDPAADAAIADWCRIAHVLHDLRKANIGLMGHVLDTMLDMQTDPTAATAAFGCNIVPCEPDEIMAEAVDILPDAAAVQEMKKRILDFFDTPDPVSDPLTTRLTEEDLNTAAHTAVALEEFIVRKDLDGFAYYYESTPESTMRHLVTNFIVGNSLLTSAGFPMCGEFDLKTCIAMLIMDRLEAGGSFAEFHPVDFEKNTVLVGHDGPHHLNIADRKPVIRSLQKYHGKPGCGASVEFNIKTGPVTLLSIGVDSNGKFKFIIAEGESVAGAIPPTGNTNTHFRCSGSIRDFLREWCMAGPTHHFALGVGHQAELLRKIASCLDIEAITI